MSKSIFVTGGSASGKSRFAVSYFSGCEYVLYLKAGLKADWDIINRIQYDTEKHGVHWDVIPTSSLSPSLEVKDHKFVIFDNLRTFTLLAMEEMAPDGDVDELMKKQIEKRVLSEIYALRERVAENLGTIIIITVESGFSLSEESMRMAAYRDILGRVNQRIANTSDEVYFSASGIQFKIKD